MDQAYNPALSPQLWEPVRDGHQHGTEGASILPDHPATYFSPYSPPLSGYHFGNMKLDSQDPAKSFEQLRKRDPQ